jgi:hypothetical protein
MAVQVLVKAWHGGNLVLKPQARYDGGMSNLFQVDPDKMSFFELKGYVFEFGSYKNKEFRMWYVVPGQNFQDGLVELKDDCDVNHMMNLMGDEIKHMIHLYCDGSPDGKPSSPIGKPSSPIVKPKKKAHDPSNKCIPSGDFSMEASRTHTGSESDAEWVADDTDTSSDEDESDEGPEEEIIETGGETDDDEEWRSAS